VGARCRTTATSSTTATAGSSAIATRPRSRRSRPTRVELAYIATEKGTWVSIEGTAEVVEDDARKRKLWDKQLEQWFQEGPEDENVVLVKVSADRIHAWADGEELAGDPETGLATIETEDEAKDEAKSGAR
jgi:general stress protein 26